MRSSESLTNVPSRNSSVTILWARALSTFTPAKTSLSAGTVCLQDFHDLRGAHAGFRYQRLQTHALIHSTGNAHFQHGMLVASGENLEKRFVTVASPALRRVV